MIPAAKRVYAKNVLSALVCLLALQPSAKVDLVLSATPARVVAEKICAPAGLEVRLAPVLAQKPVIVRLQQADPLEAMRKLAWALDADLKRDGEALVIERDPATRERIVAEAQAHKLETTRLALAEFPKLEPYDRATLESTVAKIRGIQDRLRTEGSAMHSEFGFDMNVVPAPRMGRRVVQALGAEWLASVPENQRVVFAQRPNRMQRELPQANALVRAFIADQAEMSKALETAGLEQGWMRGNIGWTNDWRPANYAEGMDLLVIVEGHSSSVSLQTIIARPDGTIDSFTIDSLNPQSTRTVPAAWPESDQPYESSELADALDRAMSGGLKEIGIEGLNRLEQTGIDPFLGGVPSGVLTQYAEVLGRNLVAVVPDDLLWIEPRSASDTLGKLVLRCDPYLRCENPSDPNWLAIKPRHTLLSERSQVSRSVFWDMLRAALRDGSISTDSLLLFAGQPDFEFKLLGYHRATQAIGQLNTGMVDWELMGIMGAIPPSARARMATGVPYASLPPLAKERVSRFVFGSFHRLPAAPGEGTKSYSPGLLIDEPTVRFSNGIPGQAIVRLSVAQEFGVTLSSSTADNWTQFVGDSESFDIQLGSALGSEMMTDPVPSRLDLAQLGSQQKVMLQVDFGGGLVFSGVTAASGPAEGKPVPIAELRGPLGDRIRAYLDKNPQR